jgi:hypothetical protein
MPVTPGGYTKDADSTSTGRTAVGREETFGKGRGTPEKKQIPFARHIGIWTIIGEGADSTDTVGAKDAAMAEWEEWRKDLAHSRYRIFELRFEFVTEGKMALHIIYSE